MPELPEVQAHAERLTEAFAGTPLERFSPLTFTVLKTVVPPAEDAYGEPLVQVGRRGKHLLAQFGPITFAVHLMQGGRLRPDPKQSAKPRGGQARWRFADERAWLLTEAGTEHRVGVWVMPTADVMASPPLEGLGPEATDVTPDELLALFRSNSQRLHSFLRDQRSLAGLGRRMANEVCHRSRLSPFATTSRLGPGEADRVVAAIRDALDEGLAFERARDDMSASADRPGRVHHRTGEPCPVCGDTIREVAYSAYTVHYCPTCQTGGKVLADNTTSRFVK